MKEEAGFGAKEHWARKGHCGFNNRISYKIPIYPICFAKYVFEENYSIWIVLIGCDFSNPESQTEIIWGLFVGLGTGLWRKRSGFVYCVPHIRFKLN